MSDKIKNILQEKFEDFEPRPTKDLWAGIEAEIQPQRRVGAMWWYAAAAAIAIMIAVIYWPGTAVTEETHSPIAQAEEAIPQEKAVAPVQAEVEQGISNKEQGFEKAETPVQTIASRNPKPDPSKTQDKTRNLKPETISSLPIQPETSEQTKEAKPEIQLETVTPTTVAITLAETVPAEIDLQKAPAKKVIYKKPLFEDIGLIELNPESVASFASSTLDELGVRSPIRYEQKKQKELKQKKSHFQLVLGKFSITHTSHKPI